ncbi:MAG: DUF58 domain-containing protein [Pseudomonadota bacterium]
MDRDARASHAPLAGAYVTLEDLLRLRLRAGRTGTPRRRRLPPSAGERRSRLRGRGIDFAEVRAYEAGDDVRNIDWRVTARMNEPHTKIFREERERPSLICVDQSRTQFFGTRVRLKSVAAAELAARYAWQALAEGDRVGGLVLGNDTASWHKPQRASRAVARMLGTVATCNQALHRDLPTPGTGYLDSELRRLAGLARTGHRIIVLSDFLPQGTFWADALGTLARHNEVLAVHVTDPMEHALPLADDFTVALAGTRLRVDGTRSRTRERYRQRASDEHDALKQALQHSGVHFASISTDQAVRTLPLWH